MRSISAFERGFTVVELATTIVIIGVLTLVVVVSYTAIQQDADIKEIEGDLTQATMKLESHRANNGAYPETQAEVDDGKGLPKSSLEREYQYTRTSLSQYCLSMASSRFDTVLHATLRSEDHSVVIADGAC